MAPSISVLITNYNYARFLPAALDSVLAQNLQPRQIVLVDDGSSDDSLDVVRRDYAAEVELVAKPNGGQASAFNAGFARCTGDLVALLDADDVWHPEKLATVVAAFERHPEAAMLRHELLFLQPGGPRDGRPVLDLDNAVRPTTASPRALVDRRNAPTSALVYPRAVLEQLLPMPEDAFRICADGYLFLLAPLLGPVIDVALPLGRYRLHGGNGFANDTRASIERALRVELTFVQLLEERGLDPVVPHHVYRQLRRQTEVGSEFLERRPRRRRVMDAANSNGSAAKRLGRAAQELLGRVSA